MTAPAVLTCQMIAMPANSSGTPIDITTLTGGPAGGTANVTTVSGYKGADWTHRLNNEYKYLCGHTLVPTTFTSGAALTFGSNSGPYISSTQPDTADIVGSNTPTGFGGNICDTINMSSGQIDAGMKFLTLLCDNKLRTIRWYGKVFGGTFVAKATMLSGEKSPASDSILNDGTHGGFSGLDCCFEVNYRSVLPTTIDIELRRTTANGFGDFIFFKAIALLVPVAPTPSRGLVQHRFLRGF